MKFKIIALLTCLVSFSTLAQTKTKPKVKPTTKPKLTVSLTKIPTQEFANQVDSVSYAVGVLVAQNFKSQKVILNPAMVAKGFEAATQGATLKMTEQECQNVVQNYMMKNQEAQALEQSKEFLPNKEAGEKFLAENKKKDSVIVTASGLQYKIIKLGTGPKPVATDKVKTHYLHTI